MGQENQDNQETKSHPASNSKQTPVITWEQPQPTELKPDSSSSNVIDMDTYRRLNPTTIDTEATVTVRELPTLLNEETVHLIIISSGFGQKHAMQTNTIHCRAA
ncbi:hypothetical protein [Paenibacillus qinlingensis]|uniref:Uncharacterized protein n=1 Tax=Paenibacillus qinlingensis TaxID=1837343 RepID=A0ABU1NWV1_9BACL|nr:hypothetical protein [Paenibacillus qinlingensis]MDR6551915.1 hypothetical protein [Paenibacillus qinlingensis]